GPWPTPLPGERDAPAVRPARPPAGATDGPERSAVSAWKSGSRYGRISGFGRPVPLARLRRRRAQPFPPDTALPRRARPGPGQCGDGPPAVARVARWRRPPPG